MGREIELKLLLDEPALRRRRAQPALKAEKAREIRLNAIYFDTPDHALARRGLALRLRREGRRWAQTVKSGHGLIAGLSTPLEAEAPAPGGRLNLDAIPDLALRAAVLEAAGDAPLGPVCETAIRRSLRAMRGPGGGCVELAIDVGEIRAGARAEPIREAELELKSGAPSELFALAKALFADGPVRLSRRNKAARGYALAAGRPAVEPVPPPVMASAVLLTPGQTAESAAAAVLRGCLDQIAGNVAAAALSDAPEGPHQLRVGLRRLRAAARAFAPAIGCAALDALAAEARDLAAVAGALRDLDVFAAEIARPCGGREPAVETLLAAVARARAPARAALEARLAAPRTAALIFDLGGFVEGRGWLKPADFAQTAALAEPVEALAVRALEARWRKVERRAARLDDMDVEARHDLRKKLKALRYVAEFFAPLWPPKRARAFLRQLKSLQDRFGALQDVAMARALLDGPAAPGADDALAQRGAGYVLGRAEARAEAEWERTRAAWEALADTRRFWR